MGLPLLLARFIPWGAAAQAGVNLAKLGMDYKVERDKLKVMRRAKDVEMLDARVDALEQRFDRQLQVMQELAEGLEKEVGRMRKGILAAALTAAGAAALSIVLLIVLLV